MLISINNKPGGVHRSIIEISSIKTDRTTSFLCFCYYRGKSSKQSCAEPIFSEVTVVIFLSTSF